MQFIQPDTIIPDLTSPQSLNRYSYVTNRPINLNDPTGHCPTCVGGFVIGAMVGAAIYATTTAMSGRDFNWIELGVASATGAIGGTLVGTGLGAAAGVATFASIGAGGGLLSAQAGYSIASKKDYKSKEMLVAAAVGAGSGAISGALGAPASVNPLSGTATALALRAGSNFVAGSVQYIGTKMVNGEQIDPAEAAIAGGVTYITDGIVDGFSLNGGATANLADHLGMSFIRQNAKIPFAKAVALDGISQFAAMTSVTTAANNMPAVREVVRYAPATLRRLTEYLPR
jgi:hypothetical protein